MKQRKKGVVIKLSSDKTVSVQVTNIIQDAKYEKYLKRSTKYLVHDEKNEAKLSDNVVIIEHQPISKRKSWIIEKIIN